MDRAWYGELCSVSLSAIYTSCTTSPTRRCDIAKLQSKTVDGERSEGVLNMAASTRMLSMIDMSINGASRTQLMMTTVSGR